MRALIVDHSAPHNLRLGEVADPDPLPHQALVAIHAFSLNFGDLVDNVQNATDGTPVATFGWAARMMTAISRHGLPDVRRTVIPTTKPLIEGHLTLKRISAATQ